MVFGYSAQFSSGSRPFSLRYQANCLTQSGSSFLASGSGRGIFAIGDCNYITPQIRAHCNSFACYQESAAFTGCSSRWRPPSSSPSSSSGTWVALAATPAHPTSTSYSNCYYYSSRRRRFCHPRNCSHRRHHYYADRLFLSTYFLKCSYGIVIGSWSDSATQSAWTSPSPAISPSCFNG